MAQVTGPLPPPGRPELNSWLLPSAQPNPSHGGHLESEPVHRQSLPVSLPLK